MERHTAGANPRSSRDIKRGPPVKQPIRAALYLLAWPQAREKIHFLLRKEQFVCPASSKEETSGSSQRGGQMGVPAPRSSLAELSPGLPNKQHRQ